MQSRDPKAPRFELLPLGPDRAVSLLSHAAENGNADAAYMLAIIYENGSGVRRDLIAATRWLQRAAALDYERVVEQLSRRCDDLLQRLLTQCDEILQGKGAVNLGSAIELRRALEALTDSTHDLEAVAAMGRATAEQRSSA